MDDLNIKSLEIPLMPVNQSPHGMTLIEQSMYHVGPHMSGGTGDSDSRRFSIVA